jgi:Flp pilus assembly protein TadG
MHELLGARPNMTAMRIVLTFVKKAVPTLAKSRRGAVAAESALVLPLLTTMILAVFEYGCVIYSYSLMQLGANRVARSVAVNVMSDAQAGTAMTGYLPGWMQGRTNVTVTQSAAIDPNANLISVRVTVPASAATPLSVLTRAVPWQLTADVTMKQELPYVD